AVSDGDVDLAVTDTEPPPVQEEVVGVAPGPDYFWIGGVWFWEGGRHVWHPGHWEHNREGFRYVPHHWDNEGGHWHLRGGNWVHN
ncbi:MAG TPA: YXWGXW repeat-containing protein, partial [Xanthomonadaceae bacterium]|nr:YXWGXW repeat-containing protein [Xanthomonadaceae bacterium]